MKETNYDSYIAIQKLTVGLNNGGLGAEAFCTLLIATLDDELKSCCEFKSLGKIIGLR